MLGALIGAAVSLGTAALSSRSTKKAANQARDAEIEVANKNNALAQQFRAENTANFTPNLVSGTRANALLDSFLYGGPTGASAGAASTASPQPFGPPAAANDPSMGGVGRPINNAYEDGAFVPDYKVGNTAVNGRGAANLALGRANATIPGAMAPPVAQPPMTVAPGASANDLSGYDQFVASPYYQTPLQEGIRARNLGYAAHGQLQSGAALKELDRFGQNYGAGRMDEFIGLAERQANRGVTGASAIAGVGQNALTAMTANNQGAGDAVANAALLRAQANNSLYGSIAGIAGNLASSFKGF